MRKLNKTVLLIISLSITSIALAQTNGDSEGGLMRSNGKLYVVVAVVLTVLIGFILYMIRLDRKISKLEKEKH